MSGLTSRAEKILSSKINGTSYNEPPQSRLENLLLQLNTSTGVDTRELTKDVSELKENVKDNQNKIAYLDTSMTKNANNISGLKTSVTAVQSKIMKTEQTIETIGTAVGDVQVEIAVMQKGVEELNTNIRDIQEDVIRIEDRAILDSNDNDDD